MKVSYESLSHGGASEGVARQPFTAVVVMPFYWPMDHAKAFIKEQLGIPMEWEVDVVDGRRKEVVYIHDTVEVFMEVSKVAIKPRPRWDSSISSN